MSAEGGGPAFPASIAANAGPSGSGRVTDIDRKSERWRLALNDTQNLFVRAEREWNNDALEGKDPGLLVERWKRAVAETLYELAGKMGERQA